jgi:hypothetical protein
MNFWQGGRVRNGDCLFPRSLSPIRSTKRVKAIATNEFSPHRKQKYNSFHTDDALNFQTRGPANWTHAIKTINVVRQSGNIHES